MAEQYKADDDKRAVPPAVETTKTGSVKVYDRPDKKGFPLWLLAIPLVALLGWFAYRATRNDTTDATRATPASDTRSVESRVQAAGGAASSGGGETARADNAAPSGDELTDFAAFTGAADRMTLVGRRAKLDDVTVQEVISDRGFFVGPDADNKMLVFLDKSLDKGGMEAAVKIEKGQRLSLTGAMEELPSADVMRERYEFDAGEHADVMKEGVYLRASEVQMK